MSGDNPNKLSTFLPIFAVAGATFVASVFSAAAVALDEEEALNREEGIISVAADAIASSLVNVCSKRAGGCHSTAMNDKHPRKYICWDRQRAKFYILQDYLGPQPTVRPDDFKRIFRVSQMNYDQLHNYLCHVEPFFWDGIDATRRKKI
jgi:hypothetical protein